MSLELPTIHLNGTSKERLLEAINDAYWKIGEAQRALAETAPNGRDYYKGLKAGADYDRLAKATEEHYSRMAKLASILAELEELAEGIDTGRTYHADGVVLEKRDVRFKPTHPLDPPEGRRHTWGWKKLGKVKGDPREQALAAIKIVEAGSKTNWKVEFVQTGLISTKVPLT